MKYHETIIVGGGPAGLPVAVVLGGWFPYYRPSEVFAHSFPSLAAILQRFESTLLSLDFSELLRLVMEPVDFFRQLHHPHLNFKDSASISRVFHEQLSGASRSLAASDISLCNRPALSFTRNAAADYLLLTRESVGGVWNNVPHNLLTLSPACWMEFAFYPLTQFAKEHGFTLDVEYLLSKQNILKYYHAIPKRFEQQSRIKTNTEVLEISRGENGFYLRAKNLGNQEVNEYSCKYLVYAPGHRCSLRKLGVPGEEFAFVTANYDSPEQFSGQNILVVGGGRSSDWAAMELFDAGKTICYVMRQSQDQHWRVINDSRLGLPYYARLAEIMENTAGRLETRYNARITRIEEDGCVIVSGEHGDEVLQFDHVLTELGGVSNYSLFKGFPSLQTVPKRDNYRYQLDQVVVHRHNYESIDIKNLYIGGYLASKIGLDVVAMHGMTYAIAADILQRSGRFQPKTIFR